MAKKRANHEGSIYKRNNGTWRALISLDGQRLSYTGKSRKECRAWLREKINQVDNGLTFEGANTTFEEYLSNWLESVKVSLRQTTWLQYSQLVRDYILPSLGKIRLNEIRPDHIQTLYDRHVKAGIGIRTIQLTHAVINRSLNRAVKLRLISYNPAEATTPPKPKSKEFMIFDDNQVQQFLIGAESIQLRNLALYQLAISTGMRQGELLGLKWQDVDWIRNTIYVQRQLKRIPHQGLHFLEPKTKAGKRKIVLGVTMLNSIKSHKQSQFEEIKMAGESWQEYDLIFPNMNGTPREPRNLLRQYKKLIQEIGLPDIRFHDLRHTAASLMLNHGIPVLIVSKRLGHAKPSITLDIYGHLIPSMQEQAAEVMDQIITPIVLENRDAVAPGLHQEAIFQVKPK